MEVWENEKLKWEHEPRSANVSTQFRVFPNFHECFYNVWNMGKNVFYFFYKITRRKLKRGSSLLYRSVNSPYCSWWRMRWRIMAWTFPCFPYSYRNTAFNQSKVAFSKCYFIINYANNIRKMRILLNIVTLKYNHFYLLNISFFFSQEILPRTDLIRTPIWLQLSKQLLSEQICRYMYTVICVQAETANIFSSCFTFGLKHNI